MRHVPDVKSQSRGYGSRKNRFEARIHGTKGSNVDNILVRIPFIESFDLPTLVHFSVVYPHRESLIVLHLSQWHRFGVRSRQLFVETNNVEYV